MVVPRPSPEVRMATLASRSVLDKLVGRLDDHR
jgi:hypothetical protein